MSDKHEVKIHEYRQCFHLHHFAGRCLAINYGERTLYIRWGAHPSRVRRTVQRAIKQHDRGVARERRVMDLLKPLEKVDDQPVVAEPKVSLERFFDRADVVDEQTEELVKLED